MREKHERAERIDPRLDRDEVTQGNKPVFVFSLKDVGCYTTCEVPANERGCGTILDLFVSPDIVG